MKRVGVVGIFIFFFSISLFASRIRIAHLVFGRENIFLSLNTKVDDVINIGKILNQGISVTLKYEVSVYRMNSSVFGDTQETNLIVYYEIKKDVINKGYEITGMIGKQSVARWYAHLDPALDFLLSPKKMKMISITFLKPDVVYYFEIYQEITSIYLLPPLSWLYQMLGNWNYVSPKIRSRTFTKDGIIVE